MSEGRWGKERNLNRTPRASYSGNEPVLDVKMLINRVFLLLIVCVPFVTNLLGALDFVPVSSTFYSLTEAAVGFAPLGLWDYAAPARPSDWSSKSCGRAGRSACQRSSGGESLSL